MFESKGFKRALSIVLFGVANFVPQAEAYRELINYIALTFGVAGVTQAVVTKKKAS